MFWISLFPWLHIWYDMDICHWPRSLFLFWLYTKSLQIEVILFMEYLLASCSTIKKHIHFNLHLRGIFVWIILIVAFMLKASNGDLRYACHFSFWFFNIRFRVWPHTLSSSFFVHSLLCVRLFNRNEYLYKPKSRTHKHAPIRWDECGDNKKITNFSIKNQIECSSPSKNRKHFFCFVFNIWFVFHRFYFDYHGNNGAYLLTVH